MSNPDLIKYIQTQLQNNVPEKDIRTALAQNNWTDEEINQAFAEVSLQPSATQEPSTNKEPSAANLSVDIEETSRTRPTEQDSLTAPQDNVQTDLHDRTQEPQEAKKSSVVKYIIIAAVLIFVLVIIVIGILGTTILNTIDPETQINRAMDESVKRDIEGISMAVERCQASVTDNHFGSCNSISKLVNRFVLSSARADDLGDVMISPNIGNPTGIVVYAKLSGINIPEECEVGTGETAYYVYRANYAEVSPTQPQIECLDTFPTP